MSLFYTPNLLDMQNMVAAAATENKMVDMVGPKLKTVIPEPCQTCILCQNKQSDKANIQVGWAIQVMHSMILTVVYT